MFPYRGPLSTSGVENTRAGDWRATRPSFRIEIGNDGWSWPTGAPITEAQALAGKGLRGEALKKALYERTARQVRFGTLTEQLPDPANRITPDPAQRDQLGIPRPRIAYRIDDCASQLQPAAAFGCGEWLRAGESLEEPARRHGTQRAR